MGKAPPRKSKRKSAGWLRWFLLLAALAAIGFFFFPVKISRVPFVQTQLNAWRRLGISAESVVLTPRGQLRARGVRLGVPVACRIGELRLELSLPQLLRGKVAFHRATGRSIQINWERLDAFFQSLQKEIPARVLAGRLSRFTFTADSLAVAGLIPARSFTVGHATVDVDWEPTPSAQVAAENVAFPGLPDLASASFHFTGRPSRFALEALNVDWEQSQIQGQLHWGAALPLEGDLDFQKLDVGKLVQNRLGGGSILEGLLQGTISFKTDLQARESLEAFGNLRGENLRLADFPFQKDPLIRDHMPALHDVLFRDFSIVQWRLRSGALLLDSLQAAGDPLSVFGNARMALQENSRRPDSAKWAGELWFDLVGHLQEDYFRTLQPLVKSTLYRDTTGLPTFKFVLKGDFEKQTLVPEKLFSRWVKSIGSGLGAKIKSVVKPWSDP